MLNRSQSASVKRGKGELKGRGKKRGHHNTTLKKKKSAADPDGRSGSTTTTQRTGCILSSSGIGGGGERRVRTIKKYLLLHSIEAIKETKGDYYRGAADSPG